jgi:hypothetical protein
VKILISSQKFRDISQNFAKFRDREISPTTLVEISQKFKQIWIQQAKGNIEKKLHKDKCKNKNAALICKYIAKTHILDTDHISEK